MHSLANIGDLIYLFFKIIFIQNRKKNQNITIWLNQVDHYVHEKKIVFRCQFSVEIFNSAEVCDKHLYISDYPSGRSKYFRERGKNVLILNSLVFSLT